ncbi:hypothetical protein D3C85_1428480 [compost metagenome]
MADKQIRDAIDKKWPFGFALGYQNLVDSVEGFARPGNAGDESNHFSVNLLNTIRVKRALTPPAMMPRAVLKPPMAMN